MNNRYYTCVIRCVAVALWALMISDIAIAETPDSTDDAVEMREVVVEANRAFSAASDATFRSADLDLLPRSSAQDLLRIVPGIVVSQHAGGGKAEQLFLRGFDADHGTDINISVDGAPVNMVSHGHGQGYADLHFIIPELVERVDVMKGPYMAAYGDLTTAGAISLQTTNVVEDNIVKVEGGLFGYARVLGVAGKTIGSSNAYVAAEYTSSDGFFEAPQDLKRLNLIGKVNVPLSPQLELNASISHFNSSWMASGQIPVRAVENGSITRFGAIDPNEGGNTNRSSLIINLRENSLDGFEVQASAINYGFQLFSNFTFFDRDPERGDMIEQVDQRWVYSLRGEQKLSHSLFGSFATVKFGGNIRYDDIATGLFYDSVRTRYETVHDVTIAQSNVGMFAEETLNLGPFTVIAGLRADYFAFDVASASGAQNAPQGTTSDVIFSPKANIIYELDNGLALFANSGFGFHSNDARVAVTAPRGTTVPRAVGAELGARYANRYLAVSAAAWLLDLDQEFVWIGDEGTTEEAGRSSRRGIDLEGRVYPVSWLTVGGNATLSRGRLLDAPEGENFIPLAPNLTLTAYASVALGELATSVRFRHINARPANETNSVVAEGYAIVDLVSTYRVSSTIRLNLQVENLLNSVWKEAQFDTQSRLINEAESVSEIHFTPGTPLSVRLGLEYAL